MNRDEYAVLHGVEDSTLLNKGMFFDCSGDMMGELLNPALLQAALKVRIFQTIQELIKHKTDLNQISVHGYSPLMSASMLGCTQGVKALIASGAEIDLVNKKGQTALWLAASNGQVEVVKMLAKAGAELDLAEKKDGKTPLMIASEYGHLPVVSALIKVGADVNYVSPYGQTALSYAIIGFSRDVKIVKKLVESGADIQNEPKGDNHVYALKPLVLAVLHHNVPALKFLLQAGAGGKETALNFANSRGQNDMVALLTDEVSPKRLSTQNVRKKNMGFDHGRE